MTRVDNYRTELKALPVEVWEGFLSANSRLPGPRANLELAQAFAEEAPVRLIHRLTRSADEYLAMCAAIGLGRLAVSASESATGLQSLERQLGRLASDDRWRVREGVAMALQRLGDDRPAVLSQLVRRWAKCPDWLRQRAAIAGICEPRLLARKGTALAALATLTRVTGNLEAATAAQRSGAGFEAVRKALSYCWSVAVAAIPQEGFGVFEPWADSSDSDVRSIVQSNLTKKRLRAADPDRCNRLRQRLG